MQYLNVLQQSPLFAGIEATQLEEMLRCLEPRVQSYDRDAVILSAGNCIHDLGIVLEGKILILQEDYWGNRNILAALESAALFAESFAACPQLPLNVSAVAGAPSVVMFMNYSRVVANCPKLCPHHRRMVENLLSAMASKNLYLNEKLTHISQRSIREKLLSYLSAEARRRQCAAFEIPLNRQQLADYLSVDRSALSAELSRLKAEGLLDYHRSNFKIMRPAP